MRTPLLETSEIVKLLEDEIHDIYRDRSDTFIRMTGGKIRISRSDRALEVTPLVDEGGQGGVYSVTFRVSKVSQMLGHRDPKPFVVLAVGVVIVFEGLRYAGPSSWRDFLSYGFFVVTILMFGGISLAGAFDEKKSNKVFPPSEVDRLKTRLNLRIEAELGR